MTVAHSITFVGYRRAGVRIQGSHAITALSGRGVPSFTERDDPTAFRISTVTGMGSIGVAALLYRLDMDGC